MKHREAFCLMLYRGESGHEEWIWNSRDGVTPFIVLSADGSEDLRHDDWFRDVVAPYYLPPVGSRIFVDLTESRARAAAAQLVDRDFERMKEHEFLGRMSREEMVAHFTKEMLESGRGEAPPDIDTVNAGMHAEFRARRPPAFASCRLDR